MCEHRSPYYLNRIVPLPTIGRSKSGFTIDARNGWGVKYGDMPIGIDEVKYKEEVEPS